MICKRFSLCICGAILLTCAAAHGQGFMLRPMRISLTPRPGQTIHTELRVRSMLPDRAQIIDVRLLDLGQTADGQFDFLQLAQGDERPRYSCRDWITLENSSPEVPALEEQPIALTIRVPRGARGFYGAGMAIQTRPQEGPGIGIVVQFLVPVLIEIQGPPALQRVQLNDTALVFVEATEKDPATAKTVLTLHNSGQTLVRVTGTVAVARQDGDNWRIVSQTNYPERRVLPDTTVNFSEAVTRRLPSATYRLSASATVSGRRLRPMTKIVDYVGDPTVSTVASDVELFIEPGQIEVNGVPGARRTAFFTVTNPSTEALDLACSVTQPDSLRGVAMGDVFGDDFTLHGWTSLAPESFRLRPGASRRVRVQVAFPKDNKRKPKYYGRLRIDAAYLDGEKAGSLETYVIGGDEKLDASPRLTPMTAITLARQEGNEYSLSVAFGNTGDVHIDPKFQGALEGSGLATTVKRVEVTREEGLLLPLQRVRCNGSIDFTGVEPGTYRIKVVGEYGAESAEQTLPIRVSEGEDGKIVEVIDLEEAGGTTSVSSEDAEAEAAVN